MSAMPGRFLTIHPPLQVLKPAAATPAPVKTTVPAGSAAPAPGPGKVAENPLSYFRSPVLSGLFFRVGRPRSAFSLPTLIAPTATPNDQTLFDEPRPGGQQHYLPTYQLATTGSGNQKQFAVSLGVSSTGYLLTVKLADVTPMTLMSNRVRETPTAVYLLTATTPSRVETWGFPNATVDGTSITLSMPISDPAVRDAIYAAMTNQSAQPKLVLRRSPSLALPIPSSPPAAGQATPPQLYRQASVAIDSTIDFYFDKDLDSDVFANLPQTGSGTPSTLNHATVAYPVSGSKSYPYWQDPLQPGQIYFLPDAYKIARLASSPHTPAMGISTSGTDPATLRVTLTFLAVPVWDENRIAAAAVALLDTFAIPKITSITILPASKTQLLLNLPPGDGDSDNSPASAGNTSAGAAADGKASDSAASSSPSPIANATIDTANGIQGSVTLSLQQFQQVYQALFVTPSLLLSGQLNVTVDDDILAVPFSGRASDFSGELFDISTTFDPVTNQVTVVATNAIESPVQVSALPVTLVRNDAPIPANVVSTTPQPPASLIALPGEGDSAPAPSSIEVVLQLPDGQALDHSTKTQIDTSQVTVNPDSRAIWNAIVQNQVVQPVQKQITLQLPAPVFAAPDGTATDSAASANALLAVQVVFQNGQTATFQPSMTANGGLLTVTLGLRVDVANYVLGQGDGSSYSYRVDTVTAAGVQHGQWNTTNVDELFVTLGN